MTEPTEKSRLSVLLARASAGEPGALGRVFDAAYPELRALAHARLAGRGPGNAGLETTVLVHEAFLRLAQRGEIHAEHRGQFFAYAGHVMRSVIVDSVRERMAQRRGSGAEHTPLITQGLADEPWAGEEEILHVHAALDRLAEVDVRLIDIVQMRYFAGMTDAEIAEALGMADRTVRRLWEKARLLLLEALEA